MPIQLLFTLHLLLPVTVAISQSLESQKFSATQRSLAAQEPLRRTAHKLSKPLIGDDRRIYTCSERNLFAFESNGSIAWMIPLNYTCQVDMAPVCDDRGMIYLIAENRVIKINPSNIGISKSVAEIFFGPESATGGSGEIIGISISTLSSCLFINVKNRGLFAYMLRGQLLWSAGPVLYRFGYRQGCRKNNTDCYFSSAPVIDQCEASIYISNTEGELYSLSIRSPQFKWIQDFSVFDKELLITPGNNGRLYVTIPVRDLVFALDVSTGNVLWQNSIGPLSKTDCTPVVDSNGWLSVGSLDGFMYSFSPTGILKKLPRVAKLDSVIQVSPLIDCSGYAVYISHTEMEGKISHTIGKYTCISAMKPVRMVFTLLVPATGVIYWTSNYPDKFSFLSESDLHQFILDERILLAFFTAANMGNPLQCHTTGQKLASSCSQARPKHLSIYTGSGKTILLFLLFESAVLILLASFVRFCYIFWRKKKLLGQDLGKFLETRRSLHHRKKLFNRTITELEQKVAEGEVVNGALERLGDMVKERESIVRKLATTYSFGRDATGSQSTSVLPVYDSRTKSFSFQGNKNESVTIFHTLSETSSIESSSSNTRGSNSSNQREDNRYFNENIESMDRQKGHLEIGTSSNVGMCQEAFCESPLGTISASKGFTNPLYIEQDVDEVREVKSHGKDKVIEPVKHKDNRSAWLKRRARSSTN